MYPDLLSLIIFGFVTAMTPGPNNIASSYSGFNFGYKKTLPLILAVISGWTLLLILMNTGLILIFKQYPFIQDIIRILGSIFLVYLAYLISFSKPSKGAPIKNPISFGKAFILQFINPKSLVVSMTTVSIFIDPENYFLEMNQLNSALGFKELSMGMSSDYLTAIKYLSTYVRIGSSIFGQRS